MRQPHERSATTPVVLFYTDNGFGLGHLTRLAAVASRAQRRFRPYFLTMSAGYPLLRKLGFPAEYFPSYGALRLSKQQWEPLIEQRVLETIRITGACLVVVDHVSPPGVIDALRSKTDGVKFIWSRRGLWQPGRNLAALALSDSFDLIVEPGDLAAPIDQGPTTKRSHEIIPTEPVVMIDRDDFVPRDEAREVLRIPAGGRAVLINFGDSNQSEVEGLINLAVTTVKESVEDDIHFFAPLHPLHSGGTTRMDGVTMRPVYPVARYLNAFDAAISTAGYNSFHEIVGSALPALFLPRSNSRIDDQTRRAEFAALCGRAHWAPHAKGQLFTESVEKMMRPAEREIAEKTTSLLGDLRGSHEFADIVAAVLKASSGCWGVVREEPPPPLGGEQGLRTTVVNAVELGDRQLRELASLLDSSETTRTIVLLGEADPSPLYAREIVFESVMSPTEWSSLGVGRYESYIESRLEGMAERYQSTRMIHASDLMTSSRP